MSEHDDTAEHEAMLLAYLRGRDVPCPACGYNLRDLARPQCPECGDGVTLRVQSVEPKVSFLVAGLVGLSLGTGFSLLLSIYFGLMAAITRSPMPPQFRTIVILYVVVPMIVQSGMVGAWLRYWRRLRRRPAWVRRLLVIGAWAVPLVNVTLFASKIR